MKENDVALIQRTLDGDEGAFTTLVNKYQKSVPCACLAEDR